MATEKDLQPHIYLPLPKSFSLKQPPKPQTKEERLRTILSNLEAHHATVRQRLITQAKAKHLAVEEQQDPQPQPTFPSALETLHANLSTPYIPGSGDPSTSSTLPPPPPGTQQIPPPPEIAIAKETLDQIELYERHARPTREYYERALGRLTGSGVGVERSGRRESIGGGRPAGPTRTVSGTSSRGNIASPVDARGAERW